MKVSAARFDVDHVRTLLEARLRREGLGPVEDRGSWSRTAGEQSGAKSRLYGADDGAARDAYLSWARSLLRMHRCFPRQRVDASVEARAVWRLHAGGKSNAEVARRLRVSRGVVEKALRYVVRRAPPPPVANPWRRSGRDAAWRAIEAKRNERRQRMANENGKQQATGWVKYALIRLKAGETVNVPGHRDKDMVVDVDGRAHVGGIDLRYVGRGYEIVDKDGKITMSKRSEAIEGADLVITVPWYKIAQAERVVEGAV